jgi:glucosamine--fructose-6-phosphate aminotransferase (isomerizing)
MCGIFGVVGSRPADAIILDGLRRLEYRGYDSAGIAVVRDGQMLVRRATGKLKNLAEMLQATPLGGDYGVGHTRWATHGRPTEENAHPHTDCGRRIVVVHNGIIENYAELKARLVASGHEFRTETDTEVIAHLVESLYRGDLARAVLAANRELRGSYACVLLSLDEPDTVVATRSGPSLVIGLSDDDESYVSSDLPALVSLTRRILHLEDGEVAVMRPGSLTLLDSRGEPVERQAQTVQWDPIRAEKGGMKHFMLKEIYEQPAAIRDTLVGRFEMEEGRVYLEEMGLDDDRLRRFERVNLIACGTAWHAGLVGRYLIEALARMPAEVEVGSEFRYRDPLIDQRVLTVSISQSGETADTLAAMRRARALGSTVVTVCNVRGSLATREADGTLLTHAGPEIGVASTKAFTAQMAALALLALRLGELRGSLGGKEAREFIAALGQVPHRMEDVLAVDPRVEDVARRFLKAADFLFLGRGINYPIALEGALKLKEISYIHAEGYAAGEMKHGPIALIDEQMPVVMVAPRDGVHDKMLSNVQEVKARGGVVIAVGEEGDEELGRLADAYLAVPRVHPLLTPFVTVVPLQLLAYHIAEKRGCDVDQPRNLAKSVTVE